MASWGVIHSYICVYWWQSLLYSMYFTLLERRKRLGGQPMLEGEWRGVLTTFGRQAFFNNGNFKKPANVIFWNNLWKKTPKLNLEKSFLLWFFLWSETVQVSERPQDESRPHAKFHPSYFNTVDLYSPVTLLGKMFKCHFYPTTKTAF